MQRATEPSVSIESRLSMLALGDFEKTSEAIASEVSLLHELSNTIRSASRESQNMKAATTFQIKDEEGNDMEDHLKHYFLKGLQDRFPESSYSICKRLSSTMILRRKRILYRRSRYVAKPQAAGVARPMPKPAIELHPTPQRREFQVQYGMQEQGQERPHLEISPSILLSTGQSATTLMPQNFLRASAPSVMSHTQTVDLGAHEDLVFPPVPQVQGQVLAEVTCPYCLLALSAPDIINQARWRSVAQRRTLEYE